MTLSAKKFSHGLGLILFLLPTYLIRFHIFGLPTTLLEVLLGIFLLAILLSMTKSDWQPLQKLGRINWAIGLFILAAIIATIVSPAKLAALGELKAFIIEPILMFYAAVLILKTETNQKVVLKWLFAAASIISLFGLVQYFTFLLLPTRFWGTGAEVERITSVFDYPNALALYLGPIFSLFFTLWLNRYQLFKKSWVTPVGLIAMLIGLLLTFSRGAWFAVIVIGAILLFKKYSWKKLLPAGLVILILLLAITPIRQRIGLGLSDPSSAAHWDLMRVGVDKIIQSPFLGNGLAGFPTTLKQANFPGEILNYPHNIFLNFWLELGLLGLIAFAWIIFLVSEQYKKHPSLLKWAGCMFLLTLIIHGLVDVPYFKNDLSILFWFTIALFYV